MSNIKQLSSGIDGKRDDAVESLFAGMPAEVEVNIDLPSRGRLYTNFQGVKVTPLLFEDEHRILLSKGSNTNPVNSLIEKCSTGVRLQDLVLADKFYLLLKIREISYGPDYQFDIICNNCKQNVKTTINISTGLGITYFPEDIKDVREVKVPMLKATVAVRFPRVSDEIYMKTGEDIASNIHRFIVNINGNDDPVFISKVVKRMHIRDLKTILKEINRNDLGINTSFQFECPHCEHSTQMEIPLTASFFSVS